MKSAGYEMDELLPLAARLAAKYTSGESSSVPYETANMLMKAVCYCIQENQREEGRGAGMGGEAVEDSKTAKNGKTEKCRGAGKDGETAKCREAGMDSGLRETRKMTAAESYRQGYEKVLEKTRRTQEKYNELTGDFQAYGNENYRDTVLKALPAFFMKYDPRFAPQETMIGLDYPTLRAVQEDTGIDAVERYVAYIALEQRFFRRIPEGMAEELLTRFHGEYRKYFFNLCNIPLRHMLAAGLLGRQPGQAFSDEEYTALAQFCADRSRETLAEILKRLTEKLVESGWGEDRELLWYLQGDTENFAAELAKGAEAGFLQNVVV